MIEQHKPTTPVSQLRPIELPPEQPIDVGRYANALRRSKLLIAAIVIAVTGIVLLMSLALPKTYSADATILFDESQSLTTTSTTDAERQLATIQKLLVTGDNRLKPLPVTVRNAEVESRPLALEVRGQAPKPIVPPAIRLTHKGKVITPDQGLPPVGESQFAFALKVTGAGGVPVVAQV